MRFETRRCVKMPLRPWAPLGELTALPNPLAGFWERNWEGERKGLRMDRERKGERKDREREKEEGDWNLLFRGDLGRGLGRRNGTCYRWKKMEREKEGNGEGRRKEGMEMR